MKIIKSVKGFTLVELLVVISIIGLLSSLAVVSLNDARLKARDALRKGDMAQLRTAFNLYFDDNGEYPACGTWDDNSPNFGAGANANGANCYSNLAVDLTSGARPYMSNIPKDPRNTQNNPAESVLYLYRYVSDGSQYAIIYSLEAGGEQIMRGW